MKIIIKVPLVLFENLIFTFFPFTRKLIENFVFNPYSFGSSHAKYSINQFDEFLKKINPLTLENKNILELGPGGSIGFGLLALKNGARKYYAIEDGNHAKIKNKTLTIYKNLLSNNELEHFIIKSKSYNKNKIEFIEVNQNMKYNLTNDSMDYIYSCAVLEHVHNLDQCFSEMQRVLAPGGIMNHQVDLRDHIFSQESLWFLNISNFWFDLLFKNTGEFINRKRFSYYLKLIQKYNLEIISIDKTIIFNGDIDKNLLKKYTKEDLETLSINLTLRKK